MAQAMTMEIPTSFKKFPDSNAARLNTPAPNTLRIPISFVRFSAA
jgi:hypothetical protein